MTVLIVTGGNTSEREISLTSSSEVKKALEVNGHQVEVLDLIEGRETLKNKAQRHHVLFPVLHGKEGEDGTLYKFLKYLGKPFVGADCKGTKTAFHKILFKKFCRKNNIPTAPWKTVISHHKGINIKRQITKFDYPCVLKAACGGSSKEVAVLKSEEDLSSKHIKDILLLKDDLFVEKFLSGVEITVGVLNNYALPVIEIIPPPGRWFDYENKYSGKTQELIYAPSVDEKVREKAQSIALIIHQQLQLGPYSRTDFIIENQIPTVLETNSPSGVGFTPQSLFPKAAQAAGISFNQLVESLIKGAMIKQYK